MSDFDEAADPGGIVETAPLPSPGQRRLRVLAGAAIFVAVSCGLYAAAPWILPPWLTEGPLIQQSTDDSVRVIWFTSRSTECGFRIPQTPDADISIESAGARHEAQVNNLSAGQPYPYEITRGERVIAAGELRTNKSAGRPFEFIVFGDSGKGTREQYLLAEQMAADKPDFLLHTGDLIYSRGERRRFGERFFRPYRVLLGEVAFWPSLGNHDISEPDFGAPYLDVFSLPRNGPTDLPPERNYWFDYGDARFVVIDTNLDEVGLLNEVAPWLRSVLAEPRLRWRFAVFHHPPYTAGGGHAPDERVQRALVPAFEEAGVDIVFSGHDHLYARTVPLLGGAAGAGPAYVISGAGGASLYETVPPGQRPSYFAAVNDTVHNYTRVRIEADTLLLRQIALGGEVLDEWRTEKPPR